MSALIKGMEMPKSCRECGIEQEGFWCGVIREHADTTCFDSGRREDCPIIEIPPHGRLIDADALIKAWECEKESYREIVESLMEEAPTIIEAEVKE